jgi:iron complex outermembrane receptor protein
MKHSITRAILRAPDVRASRWGLCAGSALGLVLAMGLAAPAMAAEAAAAAAADAGPVHIDPEKPDFGRLVDELVVTGQGDTVRAPSVTPLETTEPRAVIDRKAIDQFVPITADYNQIVNLAPSMAGTSFGGPGLF